MKSTFGKRPMTVPELAALWTRELAVTHGVVRQGFTGREFGQLKQLSKWLGPSTPAVIGWAIHHWSEFAARAMSDKGLASSPEVPHVGFLVTYHDVAVNRMA